MGEDDVSLSARKKGFSVQMGKLVVRCGRVLCVESPGLGMVDQSSAYTQTQSLAPGNAIIIPPVCSI